VELTECPGRHCCHRAETCVAKVLISKKCIIGTYSPHRLVQRIVLGCVLYKFSRSWIECVVARSSEFPFAKMESEIPTRPRKNG